MLVGWPSNQATESFSRSRWPMIRSACDRGMSQTRKPCELSQDPDIRLWTGAPDSYTLEMAAARAERADRLRIAGEALLYAVCDVQSGELLGAIDLRHNPMDSASRKSPTCLVRMREVRRHDSSGAPALRTRLQSTGHTPSRVAASSRQSRIRGRRRSRCFTREGCLRSYRVLNAGVAEDRVIHALLSSDPR